MDLSDVTLIGLVQALRAGEATPVQAATHYLDRIAENADLGAFAAITRERALDRAGELGTIPNEPPPLWGVPLADKDLVARAGVPTRYGSRAFQELRARRVRSARRGGRRARIRESRQDDNARVRPHRLYGARRGRAGAEPVGSVDGRRRIVGRCGDRRRDRHAPAAVASDGGGSIRIPAATVGVVVVQAVAQGPLSRTVSKGPAGSRLPGRSRAPSRTRRTCSTRSSDPSRTAMRPPRRIRGRARSCSPQSVTSAGPDRCPFRAFLAAARREVAALRVGATLVTPWDGWTDTTLDPGARGAYDWAIRTLGGIGHRTGGRADWRPAGYADLFTTIWRASAASLPIGDDELDLVEPYTAWLIREGRRMGAREALGAYGAAATFERQTIEAFAPFDVVITPALAKKPQPIGWFSRDTDPLRELRAPVPVRAAHELRQRLGAPGDHGSDARDAGGTAVERADHRPPGRGGAHAAGRGAARGRARAAALAGLDSLRS